MIRPVRKDICSIIIAGAGNIGNFDNKKSPVKTELFSNLWSAEKPPQAV